MNLLHKLQMAAGIISSKRKNEDNEINQYEILLDDSLDVIFAKKLIQNNGNFFYCDSQNNLVKTMLDK